MKEFTNFKFNMKTEIVFGKDTEKEVAELVKKYGGTKVLLVYGGGSIKKSGLYDTVVSTLTDAGLPYVEISGVQPNPRRTLIDEGLKFAQDEGVDFVLALGGASSIDTSKAIALGLANDGDYWQFFCGTMAAKMAPVGTIHTLSAAGSETSSFLVIIDDIDGRGKVGAIGPACRPVFAIMNPELTYSVNKYQTGAGSTDIFAHTVFRYFTKPASYLGDQYCEATLRTVKKYGPIAVENPNDYEARAELMLAGSFSHNDLTGIGRFSMRKGSEHTLEQQLSGKYDTVHGAGLSVIMPAWLQYLVDNGEDFHVAKIAQFGENIFDVDSSIGDDKAIANEGLVRFRAWLKSMGMPATLKELGIPKEDLQKIVDECGCNNEGILIGFMDLDKDAVKAIFSSVVE